MAIKLYGRDPLKMFENVFSETMTPFFSSMAPSFRVDVSEDEKMLYIDADMPGVKKEDVKISMDEDLLTISAERTHEEEEKKKDYHRIERSYGSMSRSFTVGENVDVDNIQAKYDNGVLKIVLPKKEPAEKPKKEIDVK